MNLLTRRHLATLRETLLDHMRVLQDEVRAGGQAIHNGTGERETRDFKDDAERHAHDAVGAMEVQRDIDELREVQAALYRLETGGYGHCIDWGDAIAYERLRVQPAAERCTECQMAFESRPVEASR